MTDTKIEAKTDAKIESKTKAKTTVFDFSIPELIPKAVITTIATTEIPAKEFYIVTCGNGDRHIADTKEDAEKIVRNTVTTDIPRLYKEVEQNYWCVEGSLTVSGFDMDICGKKITVRASNGYAITVGDDYRVDIPVEYNTALGSLDSIVYDVVYGLLGAAIESSIPKNISIELRSEDVLRTRALQSLLKSYEKTGSRRSILELISFYLDGWMDSDSDTSKSVIQICRTYFNF